MTNKHLSEPERHWLLVVRADTATTTTQYAQRVREEVEKMSIGKPHMAFSSKDGTVAGIYAKIAKPAGVIRSILEKFASVYDKGFVLVIELGGDWAAIGNNTGSVWLKQNLSPKNSQ